MKNNSGLFSQRNALLLFAVSAAAALVVPALFQDGMFADGTLYASVAKNSAAGKGTFWHPHFMATMHDHFHEQPPLGLFLQSLFFYIFPGIWPERVHDLVIALIDGWLIVKIWRNIFADRKEMQQLVSWPLLLFFISPVVFWAFTNNVLEITMAMFALAATDAIICALLLRRRVVLNMILASVWIICASMCKGPQGIFPIVLPGILWLSGRQITFRKALTSSLLLFAGFGLFYLVILQFEGIREAYTSWYASRIKSTFAGNHNTSGSHFALLYDLLLDLLPMLFLSALVFFAGRKTAAKQVSAERKAGMVFLLLGFSGSLPLMVTLEQRAFYLTTSIPFFAISIALFTSPYVLAVFRKTEMKKLLWKSVSVFSVLILVCVLVVTILMAGTPKRDAAMLHDVRACGAIAGKGSTVSCSPEVYENWGAVNYFQRYEEIQINPDYSLPGVRYYITTTGKYPEGWKPVPFSGSYYSMYERP